jgi:hypothetical protein
MSRITDASFVMVSLIDRYDWNNETSKIVEWILGKSLKSISGQGTIGWAPAFKVLFAASIERYRNKSSVWSTDLSEKIPRDISFRERCLKVRELRIQLTPRPWPIAGPRR